MPSRWRPAALAAGAALVLGVGLGWFGRGESLLLAGTPVTFQRQAALTHALYAADANRPVEVWATEEQRLVSWLSKRLGFALHAPDLNGVGFALVGGRLVAGNENPGALFMYENADKQRISLLVRKDAEPSRETAFRYAVEDGVGVFYWIDDACGYALSGQRRSRAAARARARRLRPARRPGPSPPSPSRRRQARRAARAGRRPFTARRCHSSHSRLWSVRVSAILGRTMSAAAPIPILVHAAAALAALVLGSVMLARRKGTASHRLLGRVWVGLMLTVALSSLWIPRFLHFTWIHLFTLLTLVAVPLAIYRIRSGNVSAHASTMKGLFIGGLIVAGIFALAPGRLLGHLLWQAVLKFQQAL